MESPSELCPYSPLSHLQIYLHGITIRISPLFALIWPYRYAYMESPSELRPYSPLSHLQIYLHGISIRISPLFALIPPADIFTWNHHQNFTLIHPYPTYRYVYIELPSEFHPYSPLSGLTDMFT